jgi:hypothetical protein
MGKRTYLSCPHCGDDAMASDADGMFLEDDEGTCPSCGVRVRVWCEEFGDEVHGSLVQVDYNERCRVRRCSECGTRGPICRHANRRLLAQRRAREAAFHEGSRRGLVWDDPELTQMMDATRMQVVAHRKREPGEVRP